MTSKSPATSSSDKPLEDLTVVELKDLCKERGIKGFAHKPKSKLLEMVQAATNTSAKSATDTSSRSRPGKSLESQKKPKPNAKTEPKASTQDKGQQEDFSSMTIAQLRQRCKDQGIKGFARKTKQQLIEILGSTGLSTSSESSNHQPEIDVEEKKNSEPVIMENSSTDEADPHQSESEDLDASQADEEESADELSSAELDAVTEDFEGQFDGDTEETMIEVSDSLILEVLDRFDRIENLLQRIAKNSDNS